MQQHPPRTGAALSAAQHGLLTMNDCSLAQYQHRQAWQLSRGEDVESGDAGGVVGPEVAHDQLVDLHPHAVG